MARAVLAEWLGLTAEDVLLLAVALLSLGAFALLVSEALRPRAAQPAGAGSNPPSEGEGERERPDRKERGARKAESGPPLVPGVDKAVSTAVAARVLEALRAGEVRVKLARDDCPGEVVLDLSSLELRCLDDEGRLRRLGEPARDEPVVEERGGLG